MASSKAKEVHTSIKKNIILLTLLFESLELVEIYQEWMECAF